MIILIFIHSIFTSWGSLELNSIVIVAALRYYVAAFILGIEANFKWQTHDFKNFGAIRLPFVRLFNTPEINQGCRNRGGARAGGLRPLRFWQISYPYLSQGRGADYARRITNCPPVFSYPPTALLTDDCLVTISYKKRQQLQFKCTVVLVFGLVFFEEATQINANYYYFVF